MQNAARETMKADPSGKDIDGPKDIDIQIKQILGSTE
jgi:hypothetical protein